jgi:uncharacterized protein (TIGR03435 family)
LVVICALAQLVSAPRKFETVSIKPAEPDKNGNSSSRDVRNITARNLITLAFNLRDFQLMGGPGWIDTESYDVLARAPASKPASHRLQGHVTALP